MKSSWVSMMIVIAIALLGWSVALKDGAENGILREKISEQEQHLAARDKIIAVLAIQKTKVDTVAAKANVVYVKAKLDFKRLADSIETAVRANDTAHPTVSLIRACRLALDAADTALSGCAQQVAIRDRLLAQKDTSLAEKDSLLALERKRQPSFLKRTGTKLLWGSIGYGACKATSK